MIGIPSIKARFLLGSLALAATSALHADEIVIEGDSHLSGTVSAITAGGGLQLTSPLSPEPLTLRAGVVKRVLFADSADGQAPGATRLKLADGDVVPCELHGLDDNTLSISTAFAGDLQVPRTALSSLELGIHPEKMIYSGPVSMQGWESDKWQFQDGQFTSTRGGLLTHPFEVPDQFILRFHLAWKGIPNFQVYFADSSLKPGQTTDRYYLLFNAAGIEIKRQSTSSREFTTLVTLNRLPDSFVRSQVDVEIRVDRTQSLLWLYIDGAQEGRFLDPVKPAPKGGGIAFNVNLSGESDHRVSNIRLLAWDAEGDRHRTEDRGDTSSDALIDAEGDRYSGQLESIRAGTDGATVLSFKSPLLEQAMTIPAKKVSTVFFKVPKPAPVPPAGKPYVLKLQGGGSLKVDSCTFSGTRIEATHALLGPLSIKRSSVLSIEQSASSTPPKPKE